MRGALALLCLVTACGGGATAPTATRGAASTTTTAPDPAAALRAGMERETALLEDLASRGCACADRGCMDAVDDELAAYLRVATMNDVMTDVESWPPDLDARGKTAVEALMTCMGTMQVPTRANQIILLRRFQGFRDAACACPDVLCVQGVSDKLIEDAKRYETFQFEEAIERELAEVAEEFRRCALALATPVHEQAVLDIKAVRAAACACEDAACAAQVQEELSSYLIRYADLRSDEATAEEVGEVAREAIACLQSARGEATE